MRSTFGEETRQRIVGRNTSGKDRYASLDDWQIAYALIDEFRTNYRLFGSS
jgi:hypothetical protein